jgi:hypothetical protein
LTRTSLVVAAALAACNGAGGRGAADLGGVTPPPSCPAYPHGSVTLFRATGSTSMSAMFQKSSERTCMTATAASCSAMIFSPLAGDAGVPPLTDAGVISVAGGMMPVSQPPSSGGVGYPAFRANSLLWSGGESLSISAAGGEVPAFATTLVAPGATTLTTPAAKPTAIARGSDLALAWSGSGIGLVDVALSAAMTGAPAVEVHCRFPLAAGHGVVPAAILANVPAGSMGAMVMTTMVPQTLSAGTWSVDVALETVVVDQAGDGVSSAVTFN